MHRPVLSQATTILSFFFFFIFLFFPFLSEIGLCKFPRCLRLEKESNIPPKTECPTATANKKGSPHRKKEDEPQIGEGSRTPSARRQARPWPKSSPRRKANPRWKAKIQERGTAPTPRRKANPKKREANPKCKKRRPIFGTRREARHQRGKQTRNAKEKNPTFTERENPNSNPRGTTKKHTTRFETLVFHFTKWCFFWSKEFQNITYFGGNVQCVAASPFLSKKKFRKLPNQKTHEAYLGHWFLRFLIGFFLLKQKNMTFYCRYTQCVFSKRKRTKKGERNLSKLIIIDVFIFHFQFQLNSFFKKKKLNRSPCEQNLS